MKHLKLKVEKLEERIALGTAVGWGGGGGKGSKKPKGSKKK